MTEEVPLAPGEVDGLLEFLGERGPTPDTAVLTVAAVLSELQATLVEVISGRMALFDADRRSLVADLDIALTRVGDRLSNSTLPTLRSLRIIEVSKLAQTLLDPEEAQRLADVVRQVQTALRTDACVEAAWWDLVDSIRDGSSTVATCALRNAQLRELIKLRGNEFWSLAISMNEPIRVGDLNRACAVALAPPADEVEVVWLAFANAYLGKGFRRVGQVQFFSGDIGLEHIRDGCPALNAPGYESPPELSNEVLKYFPKIKVEPPSRYVWARIELSGPRAHRPAGGITVTPTQWARRLVTRLVDSATFSSGGSEWVLLDGSHPFFRNGDSVGAGSLYFELPRPPIGDRFFGNPVVEPTGELLGELPDEVADAFAREEPTAVFASEGVRWHKMVGEGDAASARLALSVPHFEQLWKTGPNERFATWEAAVRHYLRDAWARSEVYRAVDDGGNVLRRAAHQNEASDRLQKVAAAAVTFEGSNRILTHRDVILRDAPAVAGDTLAGTYERRALRQLARHTRDGNSVRAYWQEHASRFDQLLHRAVRQRNRTIHGATVHDDIAGTVEPFIRTLSAWMVTESIEALRTGTDVNDLFEELRNGAQARYDFLEDAGAERLLGAVEGPA